MTIGQTNEQTGNLLQIGASMRSIAKILLLSLSILFAPIGFRGQSYPCRRLLLVYGGGGLSATWTHGAFKSQL